MRTRHIPDELWQEEGKAYQALKAAEARFRALPPGAERETRGDEYERAFYAWNAVLETITQARADATDRS